MNSYVRLKGSFRYVGALMLVSTVVVGACSDSKSPAPESIGDDSQAICQFDAACNVEGGKCHRPPVSQGGPQCDLTCVTGENPQVSSFQSTCEVGACCDNTHMYPGCPMDTESGPVYLRCNTDTGILEMTTCGDGVVQPPEECEFMADGPSCNAMTCMFDRCGDTIPNPATGGVCEPQNDPLCNANCHMNICGDGNINAAAGETCDPPGGDCGCDCKWLTNVCQPPSGVDIPCVAGTYGCLNPDEFCIDDSDQELDCTCVDTNGYGTLQAPGSDCSNVCTPWAADYMCQSNGTGGGGTGGGGTGGSGAGGSGSGAGGSGAGGGGAGGGGTGGSTTTTTTTTSSTGTGGAPPAGVNFCFTPSMTLVPDAGAMEVEGSVNGATWGTLCPLTNNGAGQTCCNDASIMSGDDITFIVRFNKSTSMTGSCWTFDMTSNVPCGSDNPGSTNPSSGLGTVTASWNGSPFNYTLTPNGLGPDYNNAVATVP